MTEIACSPRPAIEASIAHVGELSQGICRSYHRDLGKESTIALYTNPCPRLYAKAQFVPNDSGELTIIPEYKKKALTAGKLALIELDRPEQGGVLTLDSNFPDGWDGAGCGSSSADCVSVIKAIFSAFEYEHDPTIISRLAWRAEGATDSIAYGDRAVLWASRIGEVLYDFGVSFPSMDIVAFNTAPAGDIGIDTNQHRQRREPFLDLPLGFIPGGQSFKDTLIWSTMEKGIRGRDIQRIAEASTMSAMLNQNSLETPNLMTLYERLAERRALGIGIAHTGTVMFGIFEPQGDIPEENPHLMEAIQGIYETGLVQNYYIRYRTSEDVSDFCDLGTPPDPGRRSDSEDFSELTGPRIHI